MLFILIWILLLVNIWIIKIILMLNWIFIRKLWIISSYSFLLSRRAIRIASIIAILSIFNSWFLSPIFSLIRRSLFRLILFSLFSIRLWSIFCLRLMVLCICYILFKSRIPQRTYPRTLPWTNLRLCLLWFNFTIYHILCYIVSTQFNIIIQFLSIRVLLILLISRFYLALWYILKLLV